uniref:Si:ch211-244b2.3 n=1 Tax=Latimeria chalumnae TaxID=7897 RepID=H3BD26_LATCH
ISQGKFYQWQIQDGNRWRNINHDSIIEAHYVTPGAKGITLRKSTYGHIFLDFDKMEVQGRSLKLRRQVSLPLGQTEVYLWYFFDNRRWYEYGNKGSTNTQASMTSQDIENQYQYNAQGFCQFTVGRASYTIKFQVMTQTNTATGMQRRIRRRPKCSFVGKADEVSLPNSALYSGQAVNPFPSSSTGSGTWQFLAEEGRWTDYKHGHGITCSVSSVDIEQNYQQNPQGSMQFTAGGFSYTLDFSRMVQVNSSTRTERSVRRLPAANQGAFKLLGSWSWTFQGDEGVWTEYTRNNVYGIVCSVSSDDIEQNYQQNPQGSMQFTAGRFSYTLDFSNMVQTNNRTKTRRTVKRSPA